MTLKFRIPFFHINIVSQGKITAVHMQPPQIILQAPLAETAVQKMEIDYVRVYQK